MIRPDKGKYPVTQGFGANKNKLGYGPLGHDGIDLGTPFRKIAGVVVSSADLFAPRSGKVKDVNLSSEYGLRIKIDNGTNIDYIGHLSKALVKPGQKVKEGQLIAKSGASGVVTGPHTHWGVYTYTGVPLNPQTELEEADMTIRDRGHAIRLLRLTRRGTSEKQIQALIGQDEDKWLDSVYNSAWFKAQTVKLNK